MEHAHNTSPLRVAAALVAVTAALVATPPGTAAADGHNTRSLNTDYDVAVSQHDSEHFRVHYVTSGVHASTASHAETVATAFEDAWAMQVEDMGWPAPASDGTLGGDSRTDIYLRARSTLPASANAMADRFPTPSGYRPDCDPQRCRGVSGFVRLSTDMTGGALASVAKHEFNHVIQYGLAYHAGRWMYESTASWVQYENAARPAGPQPSFVTKPDVPLAQDEDYPRLYAVWVWSRWLADRYGYEVVIDAWERTVDADQEGLGGYAAALQERGTTFADEFLAFAAATAAWQHDFPWDGFSESYRRDRWPADWNMRREDGVVAAEETRTVSLDHTAYALYELDELASVEVRVTTSEDVAGGVAIVADRGLEDVTHVIEPLDGGKATVAIDSGAEDATLTAVVVNADRTVAQPFDPEQRDPVVYAQDDVTFTVEVDGEPPRSRPDPDNEQDDADDGVPAARDTADACPPGEVPDAGLHDTAGNTHEDRIDCVVWWEVASGTTPRRYEPTVDVNREQMATFVANFIVASGGSLPPEPEDHFADDDDSFHEDSINRLAEAGIVSGISGGRYGPKQKVYRDQMATFLVNAYSYRTETALSTEHDYFSDDDRNVHEARINKAAAAGFTGGSQSGDYAPRRPVRRDQMAAFIARVLDLLVEEGHTSGPLR